MPSTEGVAVEVVLPGLVRTPADHLDSALFRSMSPGGDGAWTITRVGYSYDPLADYGLTVVHASWVPLVRLEPADA